MNTNTTSINRPKAIERREDGWGYLHPFSGYWVGGLPTRDAARTARNAVKGATHVGEDGMTFVGTVSVPDEPPDMDNTSSPDVDPNPLAEDYPGQRITGEPEVEPVEQVTGAMPPTHNMAPPAIVAPTASVGADKPQFVLRTAEGFLKREQPRKPGDTATYKVVDQAKAIRYSSLKMAEVKMAEANGLGLVAWVVTL